MSHAVLLVNPRSTYSGEIAQKCFPPLNLLYLAAALRREGFRPAVLDANAFGLTDDQIAARARNLRPFLVGFPLYTDVLGHVRDLTEAVRAACPDAPIVLGGPHASSIPEKTLAQLGAADFVLRGESEDSLSLLARRLTDGGDLADIPGIVLRQGDSLGVEPTFPDVADLDVPARDLVSEAYRERRYFALLVRQRPVDTLMTSRGCPQHCGFCYNFRRRYRARTPEDVLDELVAIRQRGIRNVEFVDDTFTVDRARAHRIFDLIIGEQLDISFRIKSRVDVFDEDLARHAGEAGVYLVAFGMESGSQRMLDAMNKRTTVEMNARACRLARKYGMFAHSSWIIGYPGETPETIEETVEFIRRHRPATANVGVLRPYPRTPVWDLAEEQGTLVGDWHPDATEVPWIRLPWIQHRSQLDDICRKAMRRIYVSPHYIASFVRQVVGGANPTLGRYALQEAMKLVRASMGR